MAERRKKTVANVGDARKARIEELRRAVREGNYQVKAAEVAGKIIQKYLFQLGVSGDGNGRR